MVGRASGDDDTADLIFVAMMGNCGASASLLQRASFALEYRI